MNSLVSIFRLEIQIHAVIKRDIDNIDMENEDERESREEREISKSGENEERERKKPKNKFGLFPINLLPYIGILCINI